MITVIVRKLNRKWLDENFDSLVETLEASRKARVLQVKRRDAALVQLATALLLQETIERMGVPKKGYTLKSNKYGKPYVEEKPELYFNLSHSGDYVAVAYGDECVGVDIQQIVSCREKVAARCCVDAELQYMKQGDINQRFTYIWTIKEAYAKYVGKGLGIDFKTIKIDFANASIFDTSVKYISKSFENYVLTVCGENINNTKFEY